MDDDRDLPPLPIRPPEPPVAESFRRHSHRSKDRNSARDFATLLLLEQREHRDTQRELSRVTEQLRLQTLLTEEAERKVLEATERLKGVNEVRLAAVREAARANESLGLYKFQLETAQNEIHRAQSVFNIVEKERYQAELAGAKSRTAARRLNEKHKIHLAREEGRRLGLQEGLEAGRSRGFTELGDGPVASDFGGSQIDDYYDDEDLGSEGLASPGDYTEELYSPSPPPNTTSIRPTTNARDTPAPIPVPPPAQPEGIPATGRLSPLYVPFHDIHPTPVHNEVPHLRHEHVDVPPDGYIPQTGPDSLPLVPPPHDFLRQREPSPPRNNVSSIVEESAFARTMSPRQFNGRRSPSQRASSIRAESVRRAPSVAGSVRPVQMPTPRMNTNLPGIERQAQQRSSWASDYFGGGSPAQPSNSSGPIPISVQPPSRPESHASSGQLPIRSMGSNLFGPGVAAPRSAASLLSTTHFPGSAGPSGPSANPLVAGEMQPGFVPLGFQENSNMSPMPGAYALPPEGPADASHDPSGLDDYGSPSTHSSETSTPNTLTTPPETRRPHPHTFPQVKNPAAWPRAPGYPKNSTGPGFGYNESTSGT